MSNSPLFFDEPNVSFAWAKVFRALDQSRLKELTSLTVSFGGFKGNTVGQDDSFLKIMDTCLEANAMQSVQTVANTIFPESLWKLAKGDREALYHLYIENLPDYASMEPHKNQRGLYFARLVNYDVDPRTGGQIYRGLSKSDPVMNQLETIISHCKPGVRRSMFQASIFDPLRDHSSSAQLGFPCLQHLTVVPDFRTDTLALNAFYATQQLFEKAYGNFLGLARLGTFIAGQTGLELDRVTCFVGIEKMDRRPRKQQLSILRDGVDDLLTVS